MREAISNSQNLVYWLKGPVCTEILVEKKLNNDLMVQWEARIYKGSNFGIRISDCIENSYLKNSADINYSVSIKHGKTLNNEVYSKNNFKHINHSRWRKLNWIGNKPPETEIKYDIKYLISTGLIMNYDTSLNVPESVISAYHNTWMNADKDIGGNGTITKYMPATGGRADIGIEPKWTALYLLSMDNRMKEIMLGNAEAAGNAPVHYLETDIAKNFYNHIVSIDEHRTGYSWNEGIDLAAGDGLDKTRTNTTNNWEIDIPHQPSLTYIPYLITGEYWYIKELIYWNGFNLARDEYRRSGSGCIQDFSKAFNADDSFGLFYYEDRGFAWAMRTLSQVTTIIPDDFMEKSYFEDKLKNNIDWIYMANQENSHGFHVFRGPIQAVTANVSYMNSEHKYFTGPWQHDFVLSVLNDIIRKEGIDVTKAKEVRDRIGKFTIGRYTNHPAFNKWDGSGYYWPLSDKTGNYYQGITWAQYWNEVENFDTRHTIPAGGNTDLSRYNYQFSYSAIALSALSNLKHVEKADEAYNFLKSTMSCNFAEDPTWYFTQE